jgi:integrase
MPTLKLRQDAVRTLPYVGDGRSQCIYWDSNLAGFGLRVFSTGLRTYVCAYRLHRHRRIGSLGRANLVTLDAARKKAMQYLGMAASNLDPQAESDALSTTITVKELVRLYVENHAKKKKKSWKQDESALTRLLLPLYGSRPVTTVTTGQIEQIHAAKGTDHSYAANRFIEVVRKMFNWGRTAGKVPRDFPNPAIGIVRFPQTRRRRFVTTVEMPRLLNAINAEEDEYARHALWLLLLTGLRLNELLRSKWQDVDWDFRTLYVGKTKNGEPVLAPLSDAAISCLKQVPVLNNNAHIICGIKPGAYLVGLRRIWYRVRTAAKLDDVRIHDLRRTVGSWLVQHGESLHLVGQVLNHRDPKTTAGYAYFQTQQRERALTVHGQALLKLVPFNEAFVETSKYEAELTTELPKPQALDKPRSRFVTREILYRLVWEAPVSEVATRFGISDVGLAKACRRAAIPIPPRGYWAKTEADIFAEQPVLPPPPPGIRGTIRIRNRFAETSHSQPSLIQDKRAA